MKFWELVSVTREEPELMDRLLDNPDWHGYHSWYTNYGQLVRRQDRQKLDSELPDDISRHILTASRAKYYLSDGFIRTRPHGSSNAVMSAAEIYERYGGSLLEDVQEAGLVAIPQPPTSV
jgi:hypothetical protein